MFNVAVPLLLLPPYTRSILEGLVVSAGGITESTVKNALLAIEELVQGENGPRAVDLIMAEGISILRAYSHDDRMVIPAFNMLNFLLEKEEFKVFKNHEKAELLF